MGTYIEAAEYLSLEEVAQELGIAGSTLKVKIRAKEVPLPIKLKARVLWKKSEIEEYLESTRK
jgi:predicted DNA-binding transcriptional regulator AlpA